MHRTFVSQLARPRMDRCARPFVVGAEQNLTAASRAATRFHRLQRLSAEGLVSKLSSASKLAPSLVGLRLDNKSVRAVRLAGGKYDPIASRLCIASRVIGYRDHQRGWTLYLLWSSDDHDCRRSPDLSISPTNDGEAGPECPRHIVTSDDKEQTPVKPAAYICCPRERVLSVVVVFVDEKPDVRVVLLTKTI